MDIGAYQGIGQFGPAYKFMLEHDSHAPGSVDTVLLQRMVKLCPDTADYLYGEYSSHVAAYDPGARPELEQIVEQVTRGGGSADEKVEAIARFCAGLGEGFADDLDTMVLGGTEEEIIRRGSDWCTDVARVGCVLCQVAGIPARLVVLADTDRAYCGHVIVEAYRAGVWGAVDVVSGVVYRRPDSTPASTWELMDEPRLVQSHNGFYSDPRQFGAAAVCNYLVAEHDSFDYTVSHVNAYTRAILEMSQQGWPGGLRWIHGEDTIE